VYQTEIRDGMKIDWDAPISMDDGIMLRADVFRPIEDGRYPVIMTMGPYAKGLHFEDGYGPRWRSMCEDHPDVPANSTNQYAAWEVVDPEKWVREGYVVVRVDSRGAGRSPGVIDPFSPREIQDFHDCIEWAGVQHWSSGKVGLCGISYYAVTQWLVAARQPPHLAAIVPWEGMNDVYRDSSHHGGIHSTFAVNWYRSQVLTVQNGLGSRAQKSRVTGLSVAGDVDLSDAELAANQTNFGPEHRNHPLLDEWHASRSTDLSRVKVPLLSAGNLGGYGLHLRGNLEGFTRAASEQKWLELHGDEHWTHFYTDYGRKLQLEFLDHFLKGADNGWDRRPPVLLNVRHVDDTFTLRAEDAWPIPRTQWTPRYLDASSMSLVPNPPEAEATVTYETLGEGAAFSWTLDKDVEITGPMSARLRLSSETEDADLFLVLRVFDPDGVEITFTGAVQLFMPVAHGWLRASHRELDQDRSQPWRPWHVHTRPEPLTPGDRYDVDVEVWATSIVVPAGYRLVLSVMGRDYTAPAGTAERTPEQVRLAGVGPFKHNGSDRDAAVFDTRVTLYTGGDSNAHILLPIIPAKGA
jgi:putative CocE/NonD family hydrolase